MEDVSDRSSMPPPPTIRTARYLERDPVRGQDSINTFKEILQLARKYDVDFILLAGDLFHENRPSRGCLYQVMALLREYTLGDKPIEVELLSDPEEGKADGYSFPAINYEDPNFNVAIPVFSIHGNHDDPQGAGSEGALCALDVLSVSGLMNYMGKFDLPLTDADAQNTGIAIRPVLLRKGSTHLGLYGVGNVKDARMHFELRSNRVRMYMPKNKDDWFNILLIHQNRVKHGPQESVPEGMFDDSVDLVIWGHEHDCRIIPEPVAGKKYYISQPGSSVATSLADGESLEKHVALLTIQGKEFDLMPIPLRTVRPFVLEEVDLMEVADRDGLDLKDQMEITKYLKARVNTLIDKANAQWDERNDKAVMDGEEALDRMLPLIRLKVDTTGVTEMSNPIRFGQEFTGRIANPRDVLVFHRAKKSASKSKVIIDQPELSIDDPDLTTSEKLAKVRVATLVKEYLAAQELQLLGEAGMGDAIQMFVEKDDTHAIQMHVASALKALMKGVQSNGELDEDELEEALTKAKQDQEKVYIEKKVASKKAKGKAKAAEPESDAPSEDSMAMEVDALGSDFEEPDSNVPPPKKSVAKKAAVPAKKVPAKGRSKKAIASGSDSDDVIEIDGDEDDDEPEPPKTKRTNRAATLASTATKKAPAKVPAKKKAAASSAKQPTLSFAPTGRGSTRTAASKARGKIADASNRTRKQRVPINASCLRPHIHADASRLSVSGDVRATNTKYVKYIRGSASGRPHPSLSQSIRTQVMNFDYRAALSFQEKELQARRDEMERFNYVPTDHISLESPSTSTATASSSPINVVVCGQAGVGKSSIVNMLAGRRVADTSHDMDRCTFESASYHVAGPDHREITLWDTAGLEEGPTERAVTLDAIKNIHRLTSQLASGTGGSLVIYVVKGKLLSSVIKNYMLVKAFCDDRLPLALVVTGLDGVPNRAEWWRKNEVHFKKAGLLSAGHACIVAHKQPHTAAEYEQSIKELFVLIRETCLHSPVEAERKNWFIGVVTKVVTMLVAGRPSDRGKALYDGLVDNGVSRQEAAEVATMLDPSFQSPVPQPH
ncbi:hypothetical protein HWV62_26723 [Athelia sp. TMB]|nr:hypothetical protein HWV62_26723 [Athelia sp. TMB]